MMAGLEILLKLITQIISELEEFLRSNYHLITHIVEILAAVVGILCLKKFTSTPAKFFIFFLIYVVFVEQIGLYPRRFDKWGIDYLIFDTNFKRNHWFYTLFWKIGSILFFTTYYQKIIKNRTYVLTIKWIRNIFLYFSIIYIVFNWNDFFIRPFPILNVAGATVIFLCVALYFIETLNSNKVLKFYKSINFYISATILLWWLIITPLVFYDIYFSKADWNFVILKWQIKLFSNTLMYLTFTFALLWCDPKID